jgi:tetratricopeptide (TPR) repeat protein
LIASYTGRAVILRHLNRHDEAHQVIAAMLAANPTDFRAHVNVAEYWRLLDKPQQTAETIAKPLAAAQHLRAGATAEDAVATAVVEAQKYGPQELDVILLAAEVARARGRALAAKGKGDEGRKATDEARRILARGAEVHPKAVRAYLAVASLEAEGGSAQRAAEVIRKGLVAVPDSTELTLVLRDDQIRSGDADGAAGTLRRLRAGGVQAALVDHEEARLLALQEHWLDAAVLLERTRQDASNDPHLLGRVNLLLARCYAQLGQNDRRLDAAMRALPDDPADPLWVPAMAEVAEAHASLGRAADALTAYRRLKDYSPGAWIQVAKFEMLRALRSRGKRDWQPVRDALAAAERAFRDVPADRAPVDLYLVRADLMSLDGDPGAARRELETLHKLRPKEEAVWFALARQDAREGSLEQAAATLDRAEAALGDSPELRLARARLWAEARGPDLPAKFARLAQRLEKFSRGQQRRLLREIAGLCARSGADDLAGRLWDQLAALQPDDLSVQLIRFDRALRAGDEGAVSRISGEVQRIDGEGGAFTRMTRAALLIWSAQRRKDTAGLDEAQRLLDVLARERQGWGRVALGQALICDLRGDPAALVMYQKAVESGETNADVLRRLMELLSARGRAAEAEAVLQSLDGADAGGPDAQRLAAEVHLRADNPKGATEAAARAVPADSKNPRDHLWLGQLYWAAGEQARAEAPLRRAVELEPSAPDVWLVLLRYLAATDRKEEAAKCADAARAKVAPAERTLFLALAYGALGQTEKATELFRQARAERPDDLRTVQSEANFLFHAGQLDKAREGFRRVVELRSASAADKDFARRMIAITLAADRDYETSRTALEAIGLAGDPAPRAPARGESAAQRRTRALILALQRDRASKLEAIRLLDEDRNSLAASDQFLLVQLHMAVGNRPRVRVALAELLQKPGANKVPLYLAFYSAWLLREGDVREAESWMKQLEKLQPDTLQTAELKARILAAKKDSAGARAALLPLSKPAGAPVGLIARVCEEIGLQEEAEQLLKRHVAESRGGSPQAPLALAAYYGRRGRTADALRVCEETTASVSAHIVGEVAVNALYAVPAPEAAEVAKVGRWLDDSLAKATGKARAALLQQLAAVRNLQHDYAAAADLYRRALQEDPRDILAMNNLAFLLSVRDGKTDEALQMLERAKKLIGPNPDLLDTEAIVRLKRGEVDAARKLLEEVLAAAPSASAYFHLAQVESKAAQKLDARLAWRRAEELKLQRLTLHPLEREAHDQLAAALKCGRWRGARGGGG